MGYSLTYIDVSKAIILAKTRSLESWSEGYDKRSILKTAVAAEITDHNPPHVIFTFGKAYPHPFAEYA